MGRKSVLISGAGIAGSTAAYWLARNGWQVTVVEKAEAMRSSGNPIDVRGDAASVAHRMHIWPALREKATRVDRLVVVDETGRPRIAMDTRQASEPDREVEVPRADLAAALLSAARGEAEIVVGDSISELTQDEAGVDVRFASGSTRRFQLVLGADGLHSAVRRLTFGPEENFASPFGMYVGTMRTALDAGDPRELRLFNRPGISLSLHPGAGHPLAAFIFRSNEHLDRLDPQARKRMVESAYEGRGWICDDVTAEWAAADDVYFDAVTRVTVPVWTRGRVSLLGDAADCVSLLGDGSSNAIIGAKTLADALAAHPADHRTALTAYEAAQRPLIRAAQRRAGTNSHFLVPASRIGLGLRNASMRLASLTRRPSEHADAQA
ncbi:FAD-dependent oxidoreductase [Streptomyces xiaopingdaonensis]|uniref:FAD-dependent oxidoreductase n=1 Tax=Streptomyces xiaopingdaonensis TaxID=1565415 RepID=UPI00031E29D9|nr:FAD-dependent oxidoreductase [Streptomyces xiaopingdaonensis]